MELTRVGLQCNQTPIVPTGGEHDMNHSYLGQAAHEHLIKDVQSYVRMCCIVSKTQPIMNSIAECFDPMHMVFLYAVDKDLCVKTSCN